MSLNFIDCKYLKNLGCCCGPSTYSVDVTGTATNYSGGPTTTFNINDHIVTKCDDKPYRVPCGFQFPLGGSDATQFTTVNPCDSDGNGCSYITSNSGTSGNNAFIVNSSGNKYLAAIRFIKSDAMTSQGDGCCCRYLVLYFTEASTWTRANSADVRCKTLVSGSTGDQYYSIVFTRTSSNADDVCSSW